MPGEPQTEREARLASVRGNDQRRATLDKRSSLCADDAAVTAGRPLACRRAAVTRTCASNLAPARSRPPAAACRTPGAGLRPQPVGIPAVHRGLTRARHEHAADRHDLSSTSPARAPEEPQGAGLTESPQSLSRGNPTRSTIVTATPARASTSAAMLRPARRRRPARRQASCAPRTMALFFDPNPRQLHSAAPTRRAAERGRKSMSHAGSGSVRLTVGGRKPRSAPAPS